MKKLILSLIAVAFSLTSPALTPYEVDVQDFYELKVSHGVNVDYRCVPDSAGKAVFMAEPGMVSSIFFKTSGGKLVIERAADSDGIGIPTITVYSNYLNKVENYGDSTVRVLSVAAAPKIKARVVGNGAMSLRNIRCTEFEGSIDTGSGSLTVSGDCTRAKLSLTGTGQFQADELKATDVTCYTWGTGSIGCWATGTLSVRGAASGTIYYKGTPKIKKGISMVKMVALD